MDRFALINTSSTDTDLSKGIIGRVVAIYNDEARANADAVVYGNLVIGGSNPVVKVAKVTAHAKSKCPIFDSWIIA